MIEISQDQAYMLVVSAVRYALGRRSYIVSDTCNTVKQLAPHLTDGMLRVVIRDIDSHGDLEHRVWYGENSSSPFGDKCDEDSWRDLRNHLSQVIAGPRDEQFRR